MTTAENHLRVWVDQTIRPVLREMLRDELADILSNLNSPPNPSPAEETPLTVAEASDFLGVSKQTIYQNIARIPHKKRFGRLYFFRTQLAEYLNAGEGAANE